MGEGEAPVMAVTALEQTVSVSHPPPRSKRRPTVIPAATVAVGAGLAVIVARDGTPVWQAARFLTVAIVAGLSFRALRSGRSGARVATALALGVDSISRVRCRGSHHARPLLEFGPGGRGNERTAG